MYPHHGAGQVIKKEEKDILGEKRQYLTIKILHNDMTVMVPCENAGKAGLRRVIDEETVKKVLSVLSDDVSEMPKNWNRRFKHNRDKIKTGDIYELAEVVRNLAIREQDKGLSTGEKQMFTRAKKILASELMYALEMGEEQAEEHLDDLLQRSGEEKLASVGKPWRSPSWWPRAVANALAPTGPRRSSSWRAARCSSGASMALRAAGIEEIVVALPPGGSAPPGCVGVAGGATRSASVRSALRAARARPARGRPRRRAPARDARALPRRARRARRTPTRRSPRRR